MAAGQSCRAKGTPSAGMKPAGTYARNRNRASRRIRAHDPVCLSLKIFRILQAAAGTRIKGLNFLKAAMPSPTNRIKRIPCATANGGSFWVGAKAWKKETFWNDCTTSTKQLKY